jgi:nicotinamidase-related amidase
MYEILQGIEKELIDSKSINLKDLKEENTAIIVVDMVRGFYDVGALASSRVKNIISPLVKLNDKTPGYKKVFFIDSHEEGCCEFNAYPPHCIANTIESELIEELKVYTRNNKVIKKNSTNGFHTKEFQQWLKDNSSINNFIVTGVCTDICVETLAISLITYFNEINEEKNIIVPMDLVETYDLGIHNGDLMNLISLYKMKINGINIVKYIE